MIEGATPPSHNSSLARRDPKHRPTRRSGCESLVDGTCQTADGRSGLRKESNASRVDAEQANKRAKLQRRARGRSGTAPLPRALWPAARPRERAIRRQHRLSPSPSCAQARARFFPPAYPPERGRRFLPIQRRHHSPSARERSSATVFCTGGMSPSPSPLPGKQVERRRRAKQPAAGRLFLRPAWTWSGSLSRAGSCQRLPSHCAGAERDRPRMRLLRPALSHQNDARRLEASPEYQLARADSAGGVPPATTTWAN